MYIYKAPVCIRRDYVIFLELFNDYLFIHSEVFNWNKKVKDNYNKDLDCLVSLNDVALLVYVPKDDLKLKKFVEINGCTLVEDRDSAYIYKRGL